jgi:hypothetical protein
MKPYPNYKGNNLTEIVPRKIAFVTEGANRKKFFLFKLKQEGDAGMKLTTALALIKSGNLSEDEMKLVLGEVAEADKVDVQKAIDALKPAASEIDMEKLAANVAEKISKANETALKGIADSLAKTITLLEKMVKPEIEADPELTDEEVTAALAVEEN